MSKRLKRLFLLVIIAMTSLQAFGMHSNSSADTGSDAKPPFPTLEKYEPPFPTLERQEDPQITSILDNSKSRKVGASDPVKPTGMATRFKDRVATDFANKFIDVITDYLTENASSWWSNLSTSEQSNAILSIAIKYGGVKFAVVIAITLGIAGITAIYNYYKSEKTQPDAPIDPCDPCKLRSNTSPSESTLVQKVKDIAAQFGDKISTRSQNAFWNTLSDEALKTADESLRSYK